MRMPPALKGCSREVPGLVRQVIGSWLVCGFVGVASIQGLVRWAAQRRARGVVRHEGQLMEPPPWAAAFGGALRRR